MHLKIQLTGKHIDKYDSGRQTNALDTLLALQPINLSTIASEYFVLCITPICEIVNNGIP